MGLFSWLNSLAQSGPKKEKFEYVRVGWFGGLKVKARNADQARIAIKELRVLRQALVLEKRAILNKQKGVRASYTDYTRRNGPSLFDKVLVGSKDARALAAKRRADKREKMARALEPLEQQKQRVEKAIQKVDLAILELQASYL